MAKLPDGWQHKTIGDLITFEGGSQPPKSTFVYDPKPEYIRLIQNRDYKTDKYATYIPQDLARKFCTKDDIMIGRYGPPLFQIFRGLEGAYNVALMKAVPHKELDREYMYYFLRQENLANYLEELSQRSGGQTGVEMDKLRDYPFPLPPLAEQRAIAQILGTWDEAIALVEQLLAALQTRKQGLLNLLLIHNTDLQEGWRWAKLKDFLKKRSEWINLENEQIYRRCTVKLYNLGIFPRDEVLGSQIKTKRQQVTNEGDLLVAEIDAKLGGFGIVKSSTAGSIVSSHYYLFEIADSLVRDYLEQCIFAGILEKQVNAIGSTNYSAIRAEEVLGYKIPLPSYEMQQKIAQFLVSCDDELNLYRGYYELLQTQKRGLMQRLLTGELRVQVV